MLDAIKSVLGEHYSTFESAIAELPEIKEAFEKANPFVPLSKLDEVNLKVKNAEQQVQNLQGSLQTAQDELGKLGDLKDITEAQKVTIAESEKKIKELGEKHQTELALVDKKHAVQIEMQSAKYNCTISQLLIDKVNYDEIVIQDGKVIGGLDKQMESFKEQYPTGFGKVNVQTPTPEKKEENVPANTRITQLEKKLSDNPNMPLPNRLAIKREISELQTQKE